MDMAPAKVEAFARRIGQALAGARTAVALTQEQVAEALGVNTETISRFERGHTPPPLPRLFELAALYKVPVETLIAGGAGRALDPATDVSRLLGALSDEDQEFVRDWVAAMCEKLNRSTRRKH